MEKCVSYSLIGILKWVKRVEGMRMVDDKGNSMISFNFFNMRWLPNLGSKVPIGIIEYHDWARLHISLCGYVVVCCPRLNDLYGKTPALLS